MMIIKAIYDGKTIRLLEPLNLDKPHWLDVTVREEIKPDEIEAAKRRERILGYAGMWLNLPAETLSALKREIERRADFFPERTLAW